MRCQETDAEEERTTARVSPHLPPWRQPRGKPMVSLVNFHTNATRIGWHLREMDLRFAPGLPPGRVRRVQSNRWKPPDPSQCRAVTFIRGLPTPRRSAPLLPPSSENRHQSNQSLTLGQFLLLINEVIKGGEQENLGRLI